MALKYKTRGDWISLSDQPKVLFISDEQSYKKYFDILSEEIFDICNCVIFYNDWKKEAKEDDTEIETYLSEMQMAVMPVSSLLLESKGDSIKRILLSLKQNNIPLLPISMENDIAPFFELYMEKLSSSFRNMQILFHDSADSTEIPYKEKLEKRIKTILVNDELAEKIRKAFYWHIFLSYRKKDREKARELMSIIHQIPGCQDVAIWYDEYLIPGENWSQEINNKLTGCDSMVLCVTPSLLERGNYVQEHEYPKAIQNNIAVIPIVMTETDVSELLLFYSGIGDLLEAGDSEEIRKRLYSAAKEIAFNLDRENEVHNYLIGMAYLNGVEVEKDTKIALELLTKSATEKYVPSMEMLCEMYAQGIGVSKDIGKAITIRKELVKMAEECWISEKSKDSLEKYTNYVMDLVDDLKQASELEEATEILEKAMEYINLAMQEEDKERGASLWVTSKIFRDLLLCKIKLGDLSMKKNEFDKAQRIYQEANCYFQEISQEVRSVEIGLDLGMSNLKLAICFYRLYKKYRARRSADDLRYAELWLLQAGTIFETLTEQTSEPRAIRGIANVCELLAECEIERGAMEKAVAYLQEAMEYREAVYQLTRQTRDLELIAKQHLLLAFAYYETYQQIGYGDYKKVISEVQEAISIQKEIAEKQDSLSYKVKLAYSYYYLSESYAWDYDFAEFENWKGYAGNYLLSLEKQYGISLKEIRMNHEMQHILFTIGNDFEEIGFKRLTKKKYFQDYVLYDGEFPFVEDL